MSDVEGPIGEISELVAEKLIVDLPSRETDLIESGVLDSLALVELLFAIEEHFQIVLSLDGFDFEDFRTIERIADYVQRQAPVMREPVRREGAPQPSRAP
jgi:acyl carrier protein